MAMSKLKTVALAFAMMFQIFTSCILGFCPTLVSVRLSSKHSFALVNGTCSSTCAPAQRFGSLPVAGSSPAKRVISLIPVKSPIYGDTIALSDPDHPLAIKCIGFSATFSQGFSLCFTLCRPPTPKYPTCLTI